MKLTYIALASMALVIPSNAMTLTEAMNELAGMHCSGSACTSSETVATNVDLPDIVTTSTVKVQGASNYSGPVGFTTGCAPRNAMNGKPARVCQDVTRDGVPQSISSTEGHGPVYRQVITTTDGGTAVVYSCNTTTKELTYNGPFTDRAGAWSVSASSSSSSGSC